MHTANTYSDLDHVLTYLLPFFMPAAGGDEDLARSTVVQLLCAYKVTSPAELLLATEVIAFSLSSLDALRRSAADPDLSPTVQLRYRGNASALQRASEQFRKALERAQHIAPAGAPEVAGPLGLEPVVQTADAAVAHTIQPAAKTGHGLSRQQRSLPCSPAARRPAVRNAGGACCGEISCRAAGRRDAAADAPIAGVQRLVRL